MLIRRKISPLLTVAVLLTGLPACVNLKPTLSQGFSYTLGPVEETTVPDSLAGAAAIYILRPQVPTYLESDRLSYRLASGEVKHLSGARWAEPLAAGIARALSLYLAESGLAAGAAYYPWPNTVADASQLAVYFQRFGATASGEVRIVARWELRPADGQTIDGLYVSDALAWSMDAPDSLVAAYNQVLRALVHEIRQQVAGTAE